MSRKSKRILLTLASAAVGAACGAAVYFIRKGKADLETDFDDFKDEFEEEEPADSTSRRTAVLGEGSVTYIIADVRTCSAFEETISYEYV